MYNTFDGQFNPRRKFGTRVESSVFCFFLFATFVWDHSVCHHASAPGGGCFKKRQEKIQYGL